MASFLKFYKGMTILLLDPVHHYVLNNSEVLSYMYSIYSSMVPRISLIQHFLKGVE